MTAAAILYFRNYTILLAEVVQRAEMHTIPNLSKTGQYTAELLQVFNFSKWRQLLSWCSPGGGRQDVSLCQILTKSVKWYLRYDNIFKMAVATILDFRNSQILLAEGAWGSEMHHHAKVNESIMELLRYFYVSRWQLPPFCILKILNFYSQMRSRRAFKMHHCAKFCLNWCKGFWDITSFHFSRWQSPLTWFQKFSNFISWGA